MKFHLAMYNTVVNGWIGGQTSMHIHVGRVVGLPRVYICGRKTIGAFPGVFSCLQKVINFLSFSAVAKKSSADPISQIFSSNMYEYTLCTLAYMLV